jgi:hypothetical protein
MLDFDPRDFDDTRDRGQIRSRDERDEIEAPRGRSGASGTPDRDDDWRQPDVRPRDGDDDDARTLGRGPGSDRQASDEHGRDRRDDAWRAERDHDARERDRDVDHPFSRHLDLPRGLDREIVRDRDREYSLRGSETRTLATVGAFRVVSSRDLRDPDGSPADPRSGDLRRLREQGLIETARVPGYRDQAVTLTKQGAAFSKAIETAITGITRPSTQASRVRGNWNTTSSSIVPTNRPRRGLSAAPTLSAWSSTTS